MNRRRQRFRLVLESLDFLGWLVAIDILNTCKR